TGGTTGMPRGVVWRQEDLFFAGLQGGFPGGQPISRPEELVEIVRDGMVMTMNMLPVAPLIHGAAQFGVWIGLFTGGKAVLATGRSFRPKLIWELIQREKVTTITI